MTAQPLNMGEGKVLSVLIRLGVPAMISMFFQTLYGLVDTVFVSWLGTGELAALSLSLPLFFVAMALAKGVSVGSTALMSHARGAGDNLRASSVAKAALPLALVILCPLCLLAFPAINITVFSLFDISHAILIEVDKFVFWLAWTFPIMGFAMICEGVFLSYGDSKTPMKAMIVGNVFNIALDPFLIFTCNMGIAGASLASLIGWSVSGGLMFFALVRKGHDHPVLLCGREHIRDWGEIVRLGIPVSLSMLVMPISTVGFNYVLAPFGPLFVGAWALSARMEQMLILPLYGLSCSLIPFAGFNLGGGDSLRIREATGLCIKACYVVLVPVGLLLAIFIPDIFGFLNTGPKVSEQASYIFRLALIGCAFIPVELIMVGLAQGVKRPKYTLLINTIRVLVLRLPLAFFFGYLWGGDGVYVSHPVSMMITGVISVFLIRHLLKLVDDECVVRVPDVA